MPKIHTMTFEDTVKLELDPLAELTMTYTPDGFEELVADINKYGQLVPILLKEGKILDGRHRQKACVKLGIGVKYTEVNPDLSEARCLDLIISNSINKATGTDASKVEAYLLAKAKGIKLKHMPIYFNRLNINYVRKLSYIEKENPEYLKVLLRQNKVRLYSAKYEKTEDFGTINGVWKTLKENKVLADIVVEVPSANTQDIRYEVSIEDVMVSPAAEQAYWDLYEALKELGVILHPASPAGKLAAYGINSTFVKSD